MEHSTQNRTSSADSIDSEKGGKMMPGVAESLPALLLHMSELLINVSTDEGVYVEGTKICAHDGTAPVCAETADHGLSGTVPRSNWTAEASGGEPQYSILIEPHVDYILYADPDSSGNQMWYRFEYADTRIDLISDGEPYFELYCNDANSVIEFIEADIVSVDLGTTPYKTGVQSTIEWEVEWLGSTSAPDIYPTKARIDIISASGTENLDPSEAHLSGNGSFNWTPQQTYTDIKIRVTDNYSGSWAESSTFDVENSVALDADIDGPSIAALNEETEWTSDVEGGAVPYSYEWEYMPICEESLLLTPTCDEWHYAGDDASMEWTFQAEGDVVIRLTVTDEQDAEDVATKEITVSDF